MKTQCRLVIILFIETYKLTNNSESFNLKVLQLVNKYYSLQIAITPLPLRLTLMPVISIQMSHVCIQVPHLGRHGTAKQRCSVVDLTFKSCIIRTDICS